jgi:hypothetical protein
VLFRSAQSPEDGGRPLTDGHATLCTSTLDARPQAVVHMPHASPWPFWLTVALAVLFYAVLLEQWAVAVASVIASAVALMGWFKPRGETQET